jgi:hypothetical protein
MDTCGGSIDSNSAISYFRSFRWYMEIRNWENWYSKLYSKEFHMYVTFCELIMDSSKETILIQSYEVRNGNNYLSTDEEKGCRMGIIMCCWKNLFRNLCLLRMAWKVKFFIFIKKTTYLEWKSSRPVGRFFLRIFLKSMGQNMNTNCRVVFNKMQECIIGLIVLA